MSFVARNRILSIICCSVLLILLVSCSNKEAENLTQVKDKKEITLPIQPSTEAEQTISPKIQEKSALLIGINNSTYLFYTDKDKIKYIKKDDRIIVPMYLKSQSFNQEILFLLGKHRLICGDATKAC